MRQNILPLATHKWVHVVYDSTCDEVSVFPQWAINTNNYINNTTLETEVLIMSFNVHYTLFLSKIIKRLREHGYHTHDHKHTIPRLELSEI